MPNRGTILQIDYLLGNDKKNSIENAMPNNGFSAADIEKKKKNQRAKTIFRDITSAICAVSPDNEPSKKNFIGDVTDHTTSLLSRLATNATKLILFKKNVRTIIKSLFASAGKRFEVKEIFSNEIENTQKKLNQLKEKYMLVKFNITL